ncbi:MAG: ABC transporter substrate-binding protein [Pandoraea sp.]|uniref:ABC transporter substrate-binding protein n=1 Tax=Pandoraea sp. TaxID=1883445 RepID=UPI001229E3CA|nr:ABC transporter substrate-binding protein [Pandoraea sp.]TAM16613.1 MAG: ABC transporter substrate-binding protein [Pandoraea sp.]
MKMHKKVLAAAVLLGLGAGALQAQAAGNQVKIGFITDMSGVYADIDGPGGLAAIKMAVADFGGKVLGKPIDVLYADHQNKADVAASKAREWVDRDGVTMLLGGTNSAIGLAVNKVSQEKKTVFIDVGGGTDALTGAQCQPYGVHYAYDTVALARGTGSAVVKAGGKTWYFLTADYAFGQSLYQAAADVVKANGGKVLGEVKHPLGASDFSSYLLQAQASGAQVLGLANAGGDTDNAIKAAKEFGVNKKMKLAGLLVFINDIHSLGLPTTQGMYLTTAWYWNQNDASRKFAERYYAKMHKMPSMLQAGDYSATMTYLNAVKAAGTTDSTKVMAELKKMKIDDMFAKGYIRGDGLMIHDMYLMQVKAPDESKKPWDYFKLVATIPGEKAFTTVAESKCPLLKK